MEKLAVDGNDPEVVYRYLFNPPLDEPIEDWVKRIDVEHIPEPDFAHSLHHIETVRSFAKVMVEGSGISEYWKGVIDTAVTYHDISQGITTHNKMPHGPHSVVSAIIAYMYTGSDHVSDLVWSHNEDRLPAAKDEKSTARVILRDADQLSLMGYSGLIRRAHYWGFRHYFMEEEPEDILQEMILCDPRCTVNGLPEDYEENVRLFCLKNLFPFLIESDQIDRALAHSEANVERFFGSQKLEMIFLSDLKYSRNRLERVQRGGEKIPQMLFSLNHEEKIQKIDEKYSYLFIRKPLLDGSIIDICKSIQFCLSHYGEEEAKEAIDKLLNDHQSTNPWK